MFGKLTRVGGGVVGGLPGGGVGGGEGWLVNGAQELVVQFRPFGAASQSQWVELRTFRWVRPHLPVPQSQRRMPRSSAVDAWQHMLKLGWRRCAAPVR